MEEKVKSKEKKEIKKEDSHPHFAKIINYSKNEPWRTDIILGQKGYQSHGHLALSGAMAWYFEDERGEVIIQDGEVVKKNSQSNSEDNN